MAHAILVVDDDSSTCDTFEWVLRRDGYDVHTARSGREALATVRARSFDFVLLDLRLPDMLGTDLVRAVNAGRLIPFVLMSAFLTTDITVEAMKLGATNVVEKPLTIEALRALTSSFFRHVPSEPGRPAAVGSAAATMVDARPRCTADRWAHYVLKACESDRDLATIRGWGAHVGASRTSVSETCRLLGMDPGAARNFMRLLRAVMRCGAEGCPPEALLLASDARTLKMLFERGGLTLGPHAGVTSVEGFLANQQFISPTNEGIRALRKLLKVFYFDTERPPTSD